MKQKFLQINKFKKNELNTKTNKNVYVKNDVISTVIKRCRGEKKRCKRKIDGFRKKMIIQNLKFQSAQNTKSNQK